VGASGNAPRIQSPPRGFALHISRQTQSGEAQLIRTVWFVPFLLNRTEETPLDALPTIARREVVHRPLMRLMTSPGWMPARSAAEPVMTETT
jgi:hypothetical protein